MNQAYKSNEHENEEEKKSKVHGFVNKYILRKSDANEEKKSSKKKGNFIDRFFDEKCSENSCFSRRCLDIFKVERKLRVVIIIEIIFSVSAACERVSDDIHS